MAWLDSALLVGWVLLTYGREVILTVAAALGLLLTWREVRRKGVS